MATPITAANFKIRFPEFTSIDDATIDVFITQSSERIGDGDNWPRESSYQYAQGYFVAHEMSLVGYGQASLAQLKGLQGVTRFKADDMEIGFSEKTAAAELGAPLKSTQYGRQYIELRNRAFPGVAVA